MGLRSSFVAITDTHCRLKHLASIPINTSMGTNELAEILRGHANDRNDAQGRFGTIGDFLHVSAKRCVAPVTT